MTEIWMPQGTVYGTLMNFHSEYVALADQMNEAPYKGAPKAPVLYIKTANTFSPNGQDIVLPIEISAVQVRACVGIVVGAGGFSAVLMNDVTVPHSSFYRPPVKFNCRDGFLGVGPSLTLIQSLAELDQLVVTVKVNGGVVQTYDTQDLVRSGANLIRDVREFVDLQIGDVLMLGCPFGAPLARAGDQIAISAPGMQTLAHGLSAGVRAEA
jgi:5-oxopent-3-ene-1,2,5-tricarboxylate decarboxylase / 2-hydroxyhepta-2,4-diene-1,7-dioate isomerase